MSDQEHMNRGYLKDKLGNYQVDPPEKVWDEISGQGGKNMRIMAILFILLGSNFLLTLD